MRIGGGEKAYNDRKKVIHISFQFIWFLTLWFGLFAFLGFADSQGW